MDLIDSMVPETCNHRVHGILGVHAILGLHGPMFSTNHMDFLEAKDFIAFWERMYLILWFFGIHEIRRCWYTLDPPKHNARPDHARYL